MVIESHVDLLLVDEQSNNLIDGGHFDLNNLKIYYLIDGKKKFFFNNRLDYPKGFNVVEDRDKQSLLRIYLNYAMVTPVTHVEYGENDTDYMKTEFHRNGSSVIIQKIWYNDELKWKNTAEYPASPKVTIVKTNR